MIFELGKRKCMNKKIVELKDKLGLSRASFAKALDTSPSQMANIEAERVVTSDASLFRKSAQPTTLILPFSPEKWI